VVQVRLALLARGQVHRQLPAEHTHAVGGLEGGLGAARVRVLDVGVVILLERALDHLAVSAEQVLDLALGAGEREVGHVELGGYDCRGGAES